MKSLKKLSKSPERKQNKAHAQQANNGMKMKFMDMAEKANVIPKKEGDMGIESSSVGEITPTSPNSVTSFSHQTQLPTIPLIYLRKAESMKQCSERRAKWQEIKVEDEEGMEADEEMVTPRIVKEIHNEIKGWIADQQRT